MKITVVALGRVKAPYAEADAHYRKLLSRRQPIEVTEVKNDRDFSAAGSRTRITSSPSTVPAARLIRGNGASGSTSVESSPAT